MRDIDRHVVAERLRKLRSQIGWSVREVAEAIDCQRTQLHHVEAGEPGLGVALLLDIAKFYGVPAEEIVHGESVIRKKRAA